MYIATILADIFGGENLENERKFLITFFDAINDGKTVAENEKLSGVMTGTQVMRVFLKMTETVLRESNRFSLAAQ